ncbi:MAG: CvfB family protein [Gammaproteobacteria bacterium]
MRINLGHLLHFMIRIGKTNRLKVIRQQGAHIYLGTGKSASVRLADRKPAAPSRLGDVLDVFVYIDAEGHLAATTKIPKAQVGDFAWLKVVSVNYYGAFLDWGLPKDLLVPFSEQPYEMKTGQHYLVKIYLDDKNRIVATAKIDRLIRDESDDFVVGQKVSLLIAEKTELGYKAVVDNTHWGVLYQNEVFQPLAKGQRLDGYIRQIRPDKKIDLILHEPGYGKVDSLTDRILARLMEEGGGLPLSDKSPPEAIHAAFGVSKKAYKQAIGALYKRQLIHIDDSGIRLV